MSAVASAAPVLGPRRAWRVTAIAVKGTQPVSFLFDGEIEDVEAVKDAVHRAGFALFRRFDGTWETVPGVMVEISEER